MAVEPVPGTVILRNSKRTLEAHVIPTGAIIQRLLVPDRSGNMVDVVLGYDTLEPYLVSFRNPHHMHNRLRLCSVAGGRFPAKQPLHMHLL